MACVSSSSVVVSRCVRAWGDSGGDSGADEAEAVAEIVKVAEAEELRLLLLR